ncbi:MAG: hypothetical protein ACYC9O_04295 [Candidatus Latescibacterota bacterium]
MLAKMMDIHRNDILYSPLNRRHPGGWGNSEMIDLPYSLIIEATAEPDYFGFYSPDLEGFSGIGHSNENKKAVA